MGKNINIVDYDFSKDPKTIEKFRYPNKTIIKKEDSSYG